MSYQISGDGIEKTHVDVLESKKFRECPEGSGEVVVAVQVCDAPPVEVVAEVDFSNVTAETPSILNVALGTAGTEGTAQLPVNTVRFLLRSRGFELVQFAYVATESGTNYISIPEGNTYAEEGLAFATAQDIYFQAPNDDNVNIEILYWT